MRKLNVSKAKPYGGFTMNRWRFFRVIPIAGMALSSLLVSTPGWALVTPWQGTADYRAASSSANDEDLVGPFNTYDFGTGVVLLHNTTRPIGYQVGDVVNGYFQSFVQGHELNAVPVTAPGLNTNYELTLIAQFQQRVTNISSGVASLDLLGGFISLYFDTTPDRNYATDSGFSNDDVLLTGTLTAGDTLLRLARTFGASQFELDLSGVFGSYDTDVYEPDTIGGAHANFNLRASLSDLAFLNTVSSVQGQSKTGDGKALLAADGAIQLTEIPVPFAGWLFGPALAGLVAFNRRWRMSPASA
jgi:hypothetical protein